MKFLPHIFESNRAWSNQTISADPDFFERLCAIQNPEYLWIGCADSRVPANDIVGLAPGELFVHRNVANIIRNGDPNCISVIQYAVDFLKVSHIIVCGHYCCGGVQAAFGPALPQPLEEWIHPIRDLFHLHENELGLLESDDERLKHLCEINVKSQVQILSNLPIIRDAWKRNQTLDLHGWIYDLHDGLLHDLEVSVNGLS